MDEHLKVAYLSAIPTEEGYVVTVEEHYYGQMLYTKFIGSHPETILVQAAEVLGHAFILADEALIYSEDQLDINRVSLNQLVKDKVAPKLTPDKMASIQDLLMYAKVHELALVPGTETMQ